MLQHCPNCRKLVRVDAAQVGHLANCFSCDHSFHIDEGITLGKRITLTKRQLQIRDVEDFVVLLVNIASDGALEYQDLQKLTTWLNNHTQLEVPAVKFMIETMLRVCADGRITDEEVFEIQIAIERVLPKEFRSKITDARKSAYYDQPASTNQLDTIQAISHQRPEGLTRRQASETLDQLFSNPPASNRQLMFLRFWNRMDLASQSRREIATWMSSFINADQARWLAWDLFKKECGDDGSQRDPSFVPIGVGTEYLAKIYQQF